MAWEAGFPYYCPRFAREKAEALLSSEGLEPDRACALPPKAGDQSTFTCSLQGLSRLGSRFPQILPFLFCKQRVQGRSASMLGNGKQNKGHGFSGGLKSCSGRISVHPQKSANLQEGTPPQWHRGSPRNACAREPHWTGFLQHMGTGFLELTSWGPPRQPPRGAGREASCPWPPRKSYSLSPAWPGGKTFVICTLRAK